MRKSIFSLLAISTGIQGMYAQEAAPVAMASQEQVNNVLTLAIITVMILLVIVVILAISIQTLIRITLAPTTEAEKAAKAEKEALPSWWDRFAGLAAQPGSKMDREIGHEYDGIQELDNDMPPWFKYLFYVTILFAVVYGLNYHYFKFSPLQDDEYVQEMEQAEVEIAAYREKNAMSIDENSVVFVSDASSIESGKNLYIQNCVACHGQNGGGSVGPNLTDEYWIHGGGVQNIFKTLKYGIPEKGMIAWQNQLNPKQLQEISSFVLTLAGTNPPNAKEAQGEIWSDGKNLSPVTETPNTDSTQVSQ
jgi:cytochrome c oxidase cbb3-type subunit 3